MMSSILLSLPLVEIILRGGDGVYYGVIQFQLTLLILDQLSLCVESVSKIGLSTFKILFVQIKKKF